MKRHLLLTGGPGHDFDATSAAVEAIVADAGFETTTVREPADAIEALRSAERAGRTPWDLLTVNALRWRMEVGGHAELRDRFAVVFDDEDARVVERHVSSGGGLLALHAAVICFDAHPTWRALIGAAWDWDRSSHPPLGPVDIVPTAAGREHAVTTGVAPFSIVDELYCDLDMEDGIAPLLVGVHHGRTQPVLWARARARGRVVSDLLGHGSASLDHPSHRELLARAATWAGRSPRSASRHDVAPRQGAAPA